MPKGILAVVGHIGPAPRGDKMSAPHALAAFAALGQPTRLAIFQLLMSAEPHGLAAGAIADKVGCPHNTLSSHLSILARSGLGERCPRWTLNHLPRERGSYPHTSWLPCR